MILAPGRQLGPYEIVATLGHGGMGEVYRARDRRLNRDVAIKILPPSVADNPARRARFEREGQAISQLSHPHICAIYDVGRLRVDAAPHQGDVEVDFLVMELVDGESLEQRLRLGPLPWKIALPWAIQIAAALDAAHRRGIVHRDLKPANVMIGEAGVKLLDFGVAKLLEGSDAAQAAVAAAPTASLTAEQRIVGTIHYMSPEQLEGRAIDARADLFAFGVTLYEMLTARKAFEGGSAASISAAILKEEPAALAMSGDVPDVPLALDHVIRRALAKQPDERWQTARDLMLELRAILDGQARGATAVTARPARRSAAAAATIAAALLAAAGIIGWMARTPAAVSAPASVFTITAPEGTRLLSGFGLLAVSPDGRRISFFAGPEPGQERVWIRDLGATTATPVPGTEGGLNHFWSASGESIGFVSADRLSLQRVDVRTNARTQIMSLGKRPVLGGIPTAFWAADDTIVVAEEGLRRIGTRGGEPVVMLAPDTAERGASLVLPSPLPDGRFLYVHSLLGGGQSSELRVGTPDGKIAAKFPNVRSNAAYASGFLIYRREESLVGQPFDPQTLTLSGQPVVIAESVQYNPGNERTVFAVGGDVLAYRAPIPKQLVWKNRKGETIGSTGVAVAGLDANPSIARDGSGRIAVDHYDPAARTMNIWTYDAAGTAPKALTLASRARFPVWSPKGDWLAYLVVLGPGSGELRRIRSDGGGEETLLRDDILPFDWSPDGRGLVYSLRQAGDLYYLPLDGDRTPVRLTATPVHESSARLSPDGKWLAFTVTQANQSSVWVQAFPGGGERRQVAGTLGRYPSWSANQRELFYLAPDGSVMAVPMTTSDTSWTSAAPSALFKNTPGPLGVSPDGQRFLVAERTSAPDAITVVLNWTSLLR